MPPTSPPKSRQGRRVAAMREHIFETAIDLFRRHGFDATSMDAVAARADVARTTVFNHFASKETFLVEYHGRMNQQVLAGVESRDADDPLGAIQRLFDRFGRWAENDRPIAEALISRMFISPDLLAQDQADEADLRAWIVARLSAAQQARNLATRIDLSVYADLLIGTLSSTALDWIVGGMRGSLRGRLRKRLALLFDLASN